MKRVLSLGFSFVMCIFIANAQVNLNQLKGMGINSEEDLKRMGVSDAEIQKAKEQFFGSQQKVDSASSSIEEIDSESSLKVVPQREEVVEIPSPVPTEITGIFGHDLFKNGSVSIKKNSDRMKAPDSYIVGGGDRINITVWGFSEFSAEYTIDDLGNITPKQVGRINLKGKTFKQAKDILKSRFSKAYDLKNSQMSIEISYSNFIRVNVSGEVVNPGSYSVPSINSAFNILALAGGTNEFGSVRNIEIRRSNKTVQVLDVYEFLTSPKKKAVYLMDGDYIIVKPIKNLVTLKGAVKRNSKFELKEGETLEDLISYAGGLTALANPNLINVYSIYSTGTVLKSHILDSSKSLVLKNGDEVTVGELSVVHKNQVTLSGAVNAPGQYEFTNGETLTKLLKKANGTNSNTYLRVGHIYRANGLQREMISFNVDEIINGKAQDIQLQDLDEIRIFENKTFMDSTYVKITGMVNERGNILYRENLTISDVLAMSGDFMPEADRTRIEIERVNFQEKESDTLNYVEIILVDYTKNPFFELKPFDIVNFRKLPKFKFQEMVTIEGEVKYSGNYSLTGRKVRTADIIKRAGGVTSLAYLQMAYIERVEDSLGRIQLDLRKALKYPNSDFNFFLRPGDKIVIPKVNDIVTIQGAIGAKFIGQNSRINVAYNKRTRASHYIKKYAGGYDKNAAKRRVYAITVNGQVKKSKFFGMIKPKIEKGDKIIVGTKQKREDKGKDSIDWNGAFENLTVKITAVATLWVLVSRIN